MKNIKVNYRVVAFIAVMFLTAYLTRNSVKDVRGLFFAIVPLLVSIFIFNLLVRKSEKFKPYFLSKFNIFTEKFKEERIIDIPKDLMLAKLDEVINNSSLKLVYLNKEAYSLLATSSLNRKSWGENIYIDITSIEDKSLVSFYSVTVFQVYSWGQNESNFNEMLDEIEKSLTI